MPRSFLSTSPPAHTYHAFNQLASTGLQPPHAPEWGPEGTRSGPRVAGDPQSTGNRHPCCSTDLIHFVVPARPRGRDGTPFLHNCDASRAKSAPRQNAAAKRVAGRETDQIASIRRPRGRPDTLMYDLFFAMFVPSPEFFRAWHHGESRVRLRRFSQDVRTL